MIAQSRVPAAERAWRWALVTALLTTGTAIVDLTGSARRRHVVMYTLVCAMTWLSAALQRLAFTAARSTPPATER
jgi:hypothetical protein